MKCGSKIIIMLCGASLYSDLQSWIHQRQLKCNCYITVLYTSLVTCGNPTRLLVYQAANVPRVKAKVNIRISIGIHIRNRIKVTRVKMRDSICIISPEVQFSGPLVQWVLCAASDLSNSIMSKTWLSENLFCYNVWERTSLQLDEATW